MRDLLCRLRPQVDPADLQTDDRIRPTTTATTPAVDAGDKEVNSIPKEASISGPPLSSSTNATDHNQGVVDKDVQHGVQKIEATTQAWSKRHLAAAYIM